MIKQKKVLMVTPLKNGVQGNSFDLDSGVRRNDKVVAILESGGVGILATDTIYGIVGSALMPDAVKRIYRLRKRNPNKPMVILVSSVDDILSFGVTIDVATKKILSKVWPGKVSVILPIASRRSVAIERFAYLHRGTGTLAFRIPKSAQLRKLLQVTGPLIAPSANFEDEPPALTIRAAKKYFGVNVDFYVDAGKLVSKPSTLAQILKGKMIVLRAGAVKL
jgi:L-threonylcarbamoyladenylate synthase